MKTGRRAVFALSLLVGTACSAGRVEDDATPEAIENALVTTRRIALDARGHSAPLDFEIPSGTRSITIVVEGPDQGLFGLSSLRVGGTERVGLATDVSQAPAMKHAYFTEESADLPGSALRQSVRLGTFTQLLPEAPGPALPPGAASLRVVSSLPNVQVAVTITTRQDDDPSRLHLNLVYATGLALPSEAYLESFRAELGRIFAQASITPVFDEVTAAPEAPTRVVRFTEPQEAPDSEAVVIARAAKRVTRTKALPVVVVDALPAGVGGLSLGTPGPVDPNVSYFGVLVRRSGDPRSTARVAAHEVCHFLALSHVMNHSTSGTAIPDPIPDTFPGQGNLMESGSGGIVITPGQAFVLRGSALLSHD